jgi:hypothetical protein
MSLLACSCLLLLMSWQSCIQQKQLCCWLHTRVLSLSIKVNACCPCVSYCCCLLVVCLLLQWLGTANGDEDGQ